MAEQLIDGVENFALVESSLGYDSLAVTVVLVAGDGAKLPAPATDGNFNLVWWNATDYASPDLDPDKEIVRVTARVGDTLTITRAQEGTLAADHNTVGKTYKLTLAITKAMVDAIRHTAIKGWVQFNGTGVVAIQDSYNVSSITDGGTGKYTVVWNTDFKDAKYAVIVSASTNACKVVAIAAGTTEVWTFDLAGTLTDAAIVCVMAVGQQL